MAILLLACGGQAAMGDEPASPWLTGRALETRLTAPVGVEWSHSPLREAIRSLAQANQTAVMLDRRVDPGQPLSASFREVPLEDLLRQVAENRGLGLVRFGPLIYLGPPGFTARLRTLAAIRLEELRKLPAGTGQKFIKSQRLRWDDFAEPRKLLENLAQENGIALAGMEQVPHDLWAAADLPPLSLVDRLTLLAGQFDLTFRINTSDTTVTLVPIPANVTLVRSYPGGRQPSQLLAKWRQTAPQSRITQEGDRIVVAGLLEDHERLTATSRPSSRPAAKSTANQEANQRFTVREAHGPLGTLLQQMAGRLNLDVKIDRQALQSAGVSLEQNIAFSVEDATLDELLQAALKPAGCTFRRLGKVVEVLPAKQGAVKK
jgi:hypothetical protein